MGGERVEGRRAVTELLTAGRRRVRTVWVAAGRSADLTELADDATRRGVPVQHVTREELDELAATEVPQGVVADADPIEPAGVETLLAAPGAFLVALDGVTDPQNLGAIVRAAETAGATGLVLPRHRAARITPAVTKAAAGAIEYLPIATAAGIPSVIIQAERADVWTIGLDADGDVTDRRARGGRPPADARLRRRRSRPVAPRARALRHRRQHSDARAHRVAERRRGSSDRVRDGRAPSHG